MNELKLRHLLQTFLLEDVSDGDVTSESIFPPTEIGAGVFMVKDEGVIAGMQVIEAAFKLINPAITVTFFRQDGDVVSEGEKIAEVRGPIVHLLMGERVILNILQRMSGVATMTDKSIRKLNDSSIRVCDTRKTTPGLRMLEKYAVRVGGGKNHRYGLYDGVMIKDNHIAFAGSIMKAVDVVRQKTGHMVNIEVETETREEVEEAVTAGADIIMFDNRTPEEVSTFVQLVPDHIMTEASGDITLNTLSNYAGTGVNYISLGFLTHYIKALDISMNVKLNV